MTRATLLGTTTALHCLRAGISVAGRCAEPPPVRHREARGTAADPENRSRWQARGRHGRQAVIDTVTDQVIAQGPVASQEAIKMLGTNGGGFFNANSSHPFENPTPLTNYLELISIFAIPAGLTYTLGRMTGSPRHGWAVWAAMAILFACGVTTAYWAEAKGNPLLHGIDQRASAAAAGRQHGRQGSALWHRRFRIICDCNHRCELRCGQRPA